MKQEDSYKTKVYAEIDKLSTEIYEETAKAREKFSRDLFKKAILEAVLSGDFEKQLCPSAVKKEKGRLILTEKAAMVYMPYARMFQLEQENEALRAQLTENQSPESSDSSHD